MKRLPRLAVALLLTGCSQHVSRSEFAGDYAVSLGNERQTIHIYPNGTYDTAYYRGDKLNWRSSGKWQFGGERVTFEKFGFGISEYERQPGLWIAEPERTFWGKVEFCFDPDLNRCFVRQNTA